MSHRKGCGPRSAQGTTAEYTSPAPRDGFFLACAYGSANGGRVREPLLPLLPCGLLFLMPGFPGTRPPHAAVENDRTRGLCGPLRCKAKEARLSEADMTPGGRPRVLGHLGCGAQESSGMLRAFSWSHPASLRHGRETISAVTLQRKWLRPRGTDRAPARHLTDALQSAFPPVSTHGQREDVRTSSKLLRSGHI